MSNNIIKFPIEPKINLTDKEVPISAVLLGADKAELSSVVVIGWDKQGEFYFASSDADGGDVLWLLESAKKKLMDVQLNLEQLND